MYSIEIQEGDSKRVVDIPQGWHEVSYSYYKENMLPYANETNAFRMFIGMLGIDKDSTDIWDYAAMVEPLLEWIEEIPEVSSFKCDGKEYKIPVLGKSKGKADDRPFLSVGDWESANDAVVFLDRTDALDKEDNIDAGLVILCAIARHEGEKLDDDVFADRLEKFKNVPVDALMSAAFFLPIFMNLYENISQPSMRIVRQVKQLKRLNFSLDGLRTFCKLQQQESSPKMIQAARHWMTPMTRV